MLVTLDILLSFALACKDFSDLYNLHRVLEEMWGNSVLAINEQLNLFELNLDGTRTIRFHGAH